MYTGGGSNGGLWREEGGEEPGAADTPVCDSVSSCRANSSQRQIEVKKPTLVTTKTYLVCCIASVQCLSRRNCAQANNIHAWYSFMSTCIFQPHAIWFQKNTLPCHVLKHALCTPVFTASCRFGEKKLSRNCKKMQVKQLTVVFELCAAKLLKGCKPSSDHIRLS